MTKKWILINVLLFVVAVAAAYQLYNSVQQFEVENDPEKITPAETAIRKPLLESPPVFESYSPMEFAVIPEKNVFSESRTREESSDDSQTATGTLPASQKPTLVGVIITETQKVCTLVEPGTRGQSGQTLLKKVGDTYEGYKVTEIESDHVVLDNGTQKVILDLNDTSQPAQNRRSAAVATRVVPIGGGAAGNTPVTVASSGTTAGRTRADALRSIIQQMSSGANGGSLQNFIAPVAPGQTGANTQPASTSTPASQGTTAQPNTQAPASGTGTSQGAPRVFRTPLGDIIRDR